MKILIYGSNGWIGGKLCKLLEEEKEIEVFKGKSRVDNNKTLSEEINTINPDKIICLIGRTQGKIVQSIDYLEPDDKLVENIRDNLYAPLSLAIICERLKIHLTYLGTGCIFEYDEQHQPFSKNGFKENDLPNFFGSKYSIVKGFTDMFMHQFKNVLNVRIRMPIDNENHPRNLITKLLSYKRICNMPNSVSVLPDILPVLIKMVKDEKVGTVNLTNPGYITHNEILNKYIDIVDPKFKYYNFSIDDQNKLLKAKRSNNFLDTTNVINEYTIPEVHQSINYILQNWKK